MILTVSIDARKESVSSMFHTGQDVIQRIFEFHRGCHDWNEVTA